MSAELSGVVFFPQPSSLANKSADYVCNRCKGVSIVRTYRRSKRDHIYLHKTPLSTMFVSFFPVVSRSLPSLPLINLAPSHASRGQRGRHIASRRREFLSVDYCLQIVPYPISLPSHRTGPPPPHRSQASLPNRCTTLPPIAPITAHSTCI